jgi:hypothetical protein
MTRSRATLALYAAFGCLGYMLVGLGAVLPELRLELDLSRAEVALYPQGFALGERAVPVALVTMGVGGLVAFGRDSWSRRAQPKVGRGIQDITRRDLSGA